MKINSKQAKNIIHSLNDLIYDDIYVYDNKGCLLASNNDDVDEQILDFGKIVSHKKMILVEDMHDIDLKAILLPVHIKNNLVAIIGLVGNYAIISQYSALVVKIVEILLSESIYYQRKIRNAENNRLFLNELIFGQDNYEAVFLIGNVIGKDVNEFKYMVLIDVHDEDKAKITSDLIIGSIENKLSKKDLVGEQKGNIIIMFALDDIEKVKSKLVIIRDYLEQKYKKNVSVGISDKIKKYKDCKRAYYQAKKTLQLGLVKYNKGIFSFAEYSLELLFSNVDDELVDSFVFEVFGRLPDKEICEIDRLLRIYIDNNTSLIATSKQLFIHKNTLQYRLNKVQEITGFNPRNTMELYKLFTAINLYSKNKFNS